VPRRARPVEPEAEPTDSVDAAPAPDAAAALLPQPVVGHIEPHAAPPAGEPGPDSADHDSHGSIGTDTEADTLASGAARESTALAPRAENGLAIPAPTAVVPDPGLYAILGLSPLATDAEIQTMYRRLAARLLSDGGDNATLRRLNVAYEVLGNPVRRAEYDRARRALPTGQAVHPTPLRPGAKARTEVTRRRRPRHAVQPRYAGFGDVVVVLLVVGVAVLAGVLLIPRLSINLSGLNALSNVMPVAISARRSVEATPTAGVTRSATPTVRPGLAARFAGSTVGISSATPPRNSAQTINVRVRRDGQPASGLPSPWPACP
jgi:hypothetical protein